MGREPTINNIIDHLEDHDEMLLGLGEIIKDLDNKIKILEKRIKRLGE